jgi:hypothetical protein
MALSRGQTGGMMKRTITLQRDMAVAIVNSIRDMEIELNACHQVLSLAKQLNPDNASVLDESLSDRRQSPALLESIEAKYQPIRESLLAEEIGNHADEQIEALIARLRPEDRLH